MTPPDDETSSHEELGGGIGQEQRRSGKLAEYLDEYFERIHASFPRFMAPQSTEARDDWLLHLSVYTRAELFRAVSILAGERSQTATIPLLKDAANRARKVLREEADAEAAALGGRSTTSSRPIAAFCAKCQSHKPVVHLWRTPNNFIRGRFFICRCYESSTPQEISIVAWRDLVKFNPGIRLWDIRDSDLLPEWRPPALELVLVTS